MSGIIAGRKLLHKYQLISFWYDSSFLLLSEPSSDQVFASALLASLRWSRWELKEERGGGDGCFLKGIITVSPENVHNHSA